MSTEDIAAIGLGLETDGIEKGIKALDVLASKGPAVEKSMAGVEGSAARVNKSLATLGQGGAAGGLNKVGDAAGGAAREMGRVSDASDDASKGFAGVTANANLAAKAIASIGIAASIQKYLSAADAVTTLNNSLKLSTGSTQAAAAAYEDLFQIAQRSRVGFLQLGETYSSISRATGELGISQSRMLKVTESIANAMTIGGGSAQGMNAALVQLSQGMASGTLRGEELNSILEQAPRLAKALADGLGVPIGKLREMGQAGEITSQQIVKALESQSAVLSKEVTGATLTLGQAFTQLTNSGAKAVGEFDRASGASTSLAQAISSVASAMDGMGTAFQNNETIIKTVMGSLAGAAALTTLAAVPRAIAAIGVAVTGLSAVLAANPIVLTLLGVGAVVGGGIAAVNAYSKTADGIKSAVRSLEEANVRSEAAMQRATAGGRLAGADNIRKTIEERQKAIRDLNAELALMSNAGLDNRAEEARLAAGTEQMRAQQRAAEELTGIKQKLSGVDKDYLPTLNKLFAQYQSGAITLKEYQDLVSKLAQNNYKPEKQAAGLKAEQSAYESLIASIRAKIEADKLELSGGAALTESQRMRIKLDQDLAAGRLKLGSQQEFAVRLALEELTATEASIASVKALDKASLEAAQTREKYLASLGSGIEKIKSDIAAQEEATARMGLTKEAVADLDAAKLEMLATDLELQAIKALDRNLDQQTYDALKQQAQLYRDLGKAKKDGATKETALDLEKANKDAAKKAQEEWQRAADDINRSLTDALLRGFESGKGFAENLRDTLKNMFSTLVLRPIISAVLSPISGGIQGLLGGGAPGAAGGGIGGLMNLASLGKNAYSLYSGGLSGLTAPGSLYYNAATSSLGQSFGLSNAAPILGNNPSAFAPAGTQLTNPFSGALGGSGGAGGGTLAGAGAFAAVAAVALNALGAFTTERKNGGGLMGTLGSGDISPWEEWREGGTLFSGPSFSTMNPVAELERQRTKLSDLRASGGGDTQQAATLQTIIDNLEANYGGLAEATAAQSKVIQSAFDAMRKSAGDMADTLGLSSEAARNFTTSLGGEKGLALDGLKPEEQQAKLAEALATANNEIAQQLIGMWETTTSNISRIVSENLGSAGEDASIVYSTLTDSIAKTRYVASEYAKEGEKAIDTLTRLATSFATVRDLAADMRVPFELAGLAGADAASKIADAFGGLEPMTQQLAGYIENFYSETEKRENLARRSSGVLQGVGLDVNPSDILNASRPIVRGFVEAVLAEFGPSSPQYVAAVQQANALAGLYEPLDAIADKSKTAADALRDAVDALSGLASRAENAANARDTAGGLLDSIAGAAGYNGEGYARMREARLWEQLSAGSYVQQIELAGELTDIVLSRYELEKEAAQEQLDYARELRDYVSSLTTGALSPLTNAEKLSAAQERYLQTLSAAQVGDKNAQANLQGASGEYLQLAQGYYASSDTYRGIFDSVTQALSGFGGSLEAAGGAGMGSAEQTLREMRKLYDVLDGAYQTADADAKVQNLLLTDQLTVLAAMAGGVAEVARLLGGLPADLGVSLGNSVVTKTAQNYVDLMAQVGLSNSTAGVTQLIQTASPQDLAVSYAASLAALQTAEQAQKLNEIWSAVKQYRGIDGSHANGLSYVPFDGYRADLHKGERVLTAAENKAYTPNFTEYGRGSDAAIQALASEVKLLRSDNERLTGMLAQVIAQASQANANQIVDGVAKSNDRAAFMKNTEAKAVLK